MDVDATGLVEARRALNASDPARPVSLLALLARFAILGLRRYPELNARIEQDEIVVPDHVHLGFAAQTDHGLVVPVVHDAHRLSTRDLSARLAERTAAARERRLAPADLPGGTFTVNNYGVFGVDGSAAIINHPEVAILGMGRIIDRPWVVDGQLAVRKVAELTLAFDHRVCDGGTAGGFLRYVADCVESPDRRDGRHVASAARVTRRTAAPARRRGSRGGPPRPAPSRRAGSGSLPCRAARPAGAASPIPRSAGRAGPRRAPCRAGPRG